MISTFLPRKNLKCINYNSIRMILPINNCIKNKRNNLQSGNVNPFITTKFRHNNIIRYSFGGTTVFGNNNNIIELNAYGKTEGSNGGYGSSIKNRF